MIKIMYDVSDYEFNVNCNKYFKLFDMNDFIGRPVRTLSLGQRMKCEIVAAFIHNPELVFLDEPTIGLDVFSKDIIADFLNEIKMEKKTTLILATHDLNEISKICDRALLLDHGEIIIDNEFEYIASMGSKSNGITIVTENRVPDMTTIDLSKYKVTCEEYKILFNDIESSEIQSVIPITMHNNKINDISITEINFCETVKNFYRGTINEK